MTYIHERAKWPDLTWDAGQLAEKLMLVRHKQGYLLGRLSALGFDIQTEAVLKTLTTDIIKSNEIEGEYLDPDQVRSSLAKRLGIDDAGLPAASRHIDGIVEMMLDATQQCQQALTADRLFGWHHLLFPTGRSGMRQITIANWRTADAGPMQVVSGPIGREKVHYEAPSAKRLVEEMSAFLDWFNHEEGVDPIIKAGAAHFWFVTIHPFEDGNGRIARAIADLCLTRADGVPQRFYSMSASIECARKQYYEILEHTQGGGLNITAWLQWFLDCLLDAIEQADVTLEKVLAKAAIFERLSKHNINDRQRKMLNLLFGNFQGKLSTSKYAKIAKCSHDTALRDIQVLIDYSVLEKDPASGSGRGTRYVLVSR
ncbi:MAG: cell division protein Fic [marine bacterium B5-7]|nr:MAG: cell division protein Fic [marine bacterium B5-7]